MRSLAWCVAALAAACGTSDRPATVEVVALEILAPSCGQVQCHSTTTAIDSYAFDTFDAAKVALKKLVPGGTGSGKHHRSLMQVLTDTGGKRMPPDSPMDSQDIALIQAWIDAGAQGL
jgi:hypothetical protein